MARRSDRIRHKRTFVPYFAGTSEWLQRADGKYRSTDLWLWSFPSASVSSGVAAFAAVRR
ncbi:hypothetical protein A9R05_39155 (plasmid) [Burkholderia sp. KK1]|nr:hypothetical protein A9R05_39155 [Burkholderia sp. KK1]